MKKKTEVNGDTTIETTTTQTTLPTANPPPKVGAPATPTGWKRSKWVSPREGTRPTAAQSDAATAAAAELEKSTTYVADFGANAPPAAQVAQNLLTASQWRDEWEKGKAWTDYCAEQRQLWADASLADVATLKPAYDYAASRDPSVAKRYPSTKLVVGGRSEISVRSAASRSKAEKAKAAASAASTAAPAPAVVAKSTTLN